jgi:hypothetical protein
MRGRVGVGLSLVVASTAIGAQPVVKLAGPDVRYAPEFVGIEGVREQSDGQVVVLDRLDMKIWRLPSATGTPVPLGRSGSGPGEYVLPFTLTALPGDTTLIHDMAGGGRVVMITRAGVSKDVLRSASGLSGPQLFQRAEVYADLAGRFYEDAQRVITRNGKRVLDDSNGVRRVDRRGRVDTVASYRRVIRSPLFRPPTRRPDGSLQGVERSAGAPPPFFSVDQWAVAPDGRIALVTVDPYQVRFVAPDGRASSGPPIRYTAVRLSDGHKVAWREDAGAPKATVRYSQGEMSGGFTRPKVQEPVAWPAVLPPFLVDAVRFAPDGLLWVQRTVPAGAPSRVDVIDGTGVVVRQVELPAGRRLVGFGPRTVYLARVDDDDVEHLERYARP